MFTAKLTKSKKRSSQSGFTMIVSLIVASVAALFLCRELARSSVSAHSVAASQDRGANYLAAEDGFNKVLTWMRSNSTGLAMQFSRNNFYTNFTRNPYPTTGVNDTAPVTVPSRMIVKNTTNSIVLTNSASLGTSAFPTGTDTVTGATFNPVTSFANTSFGGQLVKISLMDAPPMDSTKDYGPPPAQAPATDFVPTFRIDSMNGTNSGAHVFGTVKATLSINYGMGFYGRDLLNISQPCDSYLSNNGAYSNATKRANCSAGSNSIGEVHLNTDLYGSLKTNGSINSSPPYGGNVCADFTSGCPNTGQTCQGASCGVPGLPTYSPWATYCPQTQGATIIAANTTLTAGNTPATSCWTSITVNNNKVLTLTSTTNSYFIDTFNIANNSVVAFSPSPNTGTINLYVRNFSGNSFNGNQIFNSSNKPYQLRIHYLGTNALTMNGTAQMNAFVVAPYAPVTVSGNFTFQGGIKATSLALTGSGAIHYDESGDITTISDVMYRVKNFEEYFR